MSAPQSPQTTAARVIGSNPEVICHTPAQQACAIKRPRVIGWFEGCHDGGGLGAATIVQTLQTSVKISPAMCLTRDTLNAVFGRP